MKSSYTWEKTGLAIGIILAITNLSFATIAYSDSDLRNPVGYSDLNAFNYPNILLGIPAVIATSIIMKPWFQFKEYPQGADQSEILKIGDENMKIIDNKRQATLFIELFIALTIYWFGIGFFLGWIFYKLFKKTRLTI